MPISIQPYSRSGNRPADGEAPFAPGEVFYSRTDHRGVILSGNSVFQRVADYSWENLVGAPHKIIRHEDMPKGVFYIMWDRLLKGQAVGAYVKNKACDGLYYWVFAVVTPWQDGFLSARIKPTSERLRSVKTLYAQLRQAELNEGLSAQASAQKIEDAVCAMGFDSYEDFAADSMTEELLSESQHAGWAPSPRISASRVLLSHVHTLGENADCLRRAFDALTGVPRNLQIKAKRIEPTGGPLTALSSDYGRMSQDMSVWFLEKIVGHDNNFDKIARGIKRSLLFNGTREILARCHSQLAVDKQVSEQFCVDAERDLLEAMIAQYAGEVSQELSKLELEATRLSKACNEMRRALLGLNTVRVTGKIESARLVDDNSSLDEIIAHLGASQEQVETYLENVRQAVDTICRGVRDAQGIEARPDLYPTPPTPRTVPARRSA